MFNQKNVCTLPYIVSVAAGSFPKVILYYRSLKLTNSRTHLIWAHSKQQKRTDKYMFKSIQNKPSCAKRVLMHRIVLLALGLCFRLFEAWFVKIIWQERNAVSKLFVVNYFSFCCSIYLFIFPRVEGPHPNKFFIDSGKLMAARPPGFFFLFFCWRTCAEAQAHKEFLVHGLWPNLKKQENMGSRRSPFIRDMSQSMGQTVAPQASVFFARLGCSPRNTTQWRCFQPSSPIIFLDIPFLVHVLVLYLSYNLWWLMIWLVSCIRTCVRPCLVSKSSFVCDKYYSIMD